MIDGVDYAFSQPSPAGLYAAGKRFAMRYVGPGSDSKHLHAAERDAIWAAGLDIVLLAEGTADGALGGSVAGRSHATSASTAAEWLGAPSTLPIYFAVDFDVTAAQWPAVASYLRGAASVIGLGRVGIYGGIRAMQWAARDGVAVWFFQTFAWSAGQWYGGNHVEQYRNGVQLAGGTVDLCRAKQAQFGQWGPDTTKEDDVVVLHCAENGGYYSYPVPKWFTSVPAAKAAAAAYGVSIQEVPTLAEVRANFGPVPGNAAMLAVGAADLLADAYGNVVPATAAVPPMLPGAVDLSDASVEKVADATADELHDRLAQ